MILMIVLRTLLAIVSAIAVGLLSDALRQCAHRVGNATLDDQLDETCLTKV